MRVVLDTNILISACWKPGGLEEQVLELGLRGDFQLVASPQLWAEYREVLGRPKFTKLKDRIDVMLSRLATAMVTVEAPDRIELATDPDDNLVLECAQAAEAQYLVTGNLKDFPTDWSVARIVNARQFVEATGYCNFTCSAVP